MKRCWCGRSFRNATPAKRGRGGAKIAKYAKGGESAQYSEKRLKAKELKSLLADYFQSFSLKDKAAIPTMIKP
jgi:hypothetical protein